jgi:hypothetical protein
MQKICVLGMAEHNNLAVELMANFKYTMKIAVLEWKALKKETKLKLLRYAMLESKYKYAK